MKKIYCTAPWHGITVRENGIDLQEDILKKLQQNSINGIVTKQEVYFQLAYYDNWNGRKFSELWPELDILLQQNLS